MGREARRIRRLVGGGSALADRRLLRRLEAEGHTCPCCGGPLTWTVESRAEHAARMLAEGIEVAR